MTRGPFLLPSLLAGCPPPPSAIFLVSCLEPRAEMHGDGQEHHQVVRLGRGQRTRREAHRCRTDEDRRDAYKEAFLAETGEGEAAVVSEAG